MQLFTHFLLFASPQEKTSIIFFNTISYYGVGEISSVQIEY